MYIQPFYLIHIVSKSYLHKISYWSWSNLTSLLELFKPVWLKGGIISTTESVISQNIFIFSPSFYAKTDQSYTFFLKMYNLTIFVLLKFIVDLTVAWIENGNHLEFKMPENYVPECGTYFLWTLNHQIYII